MSPDEFITRLRAITAANSEAGARLVNRLGELVQSAARSDLRSASSSDLASRWLELNLATFEALSNQSTALLSDLLAAAEKSLQGASVGGTAPQPPPRAELELAGRPGETATVDFQIQNHLDRSLTVRFEPADLVPQTGPALPGSLLTFAPQPVVIEAKSVAVVRASVRVTPNFQVNQTYASVVRLVGFEAREMLLQLSVLEPQPAKKPVTSEPPIPAKPKRTSPVRRSGKKKVAARAEPAAKATPKKATRKSGRKKAAKKKRARSKT